MIPELPASVLRRTAAIDTYGFATTAELEPLERIPDQKRALEALDFGIAVASPGFNVYLLGVEGSGRRTTALAMLRREAANRPVPDDWCYFNDFAEGRRPRALRLPAGTGRRLAEDMEAFVAGLARELPRMFGSEEYQAQRNAIIERVEARRKEAVESVAKEADRHGLAMLGGPQMILLTPKGEDGQILSDEESARLPAEERDRIEKAREVVRKVLEAALVPVAELVQRSGQELRDLGRRTAEAAVAQQMASLRTRYRDLPQVVEFLTAVEADLFRVIGKLTEATNADPETLTRVFGSEDFDRRYKVNVVVSRDGDRGAPVVEEPNPTFANLIGRIERRLREGALTTDFLHIRAGALMRANGGYLVLDALELLRRPLAWDALRRALKQRAVQIEEPGADLGLIITESLQPEPIPLDAKVLLIGPPIIYYLLHTLDPDFRHIFRVQADFSPTVERTREMELEYARAIAGLCRHEGLPHIDAAGVGVLVEHASRQAGDQARLTARLDELADVAREAGFLARQRHTDVATRPDVEAALQARRHRANRLEEEVDRHIKDGTLAIHTTGTAVGVVNGLAVLSLGEYAFARPVRVSAAVALGGKGIVDIERESTLGQPIHSKAVLILSGFLNQRYGSTRPLAITATLAFEQVYEGVEGDSASIAEALALLSAISGTPLRQDIAVTGSMDQHGRVQAVGAVTEKIEGFHRACRVQGETTSQGVLIPAANVQHVMLDAEALDAVSTGRFHVYAVRQLDEAIELCFDQPASVVHAAVESQLDAFATAWKELQGRGPTAPGPDR